jgi:hypothetical protein
VTQQLALEYDDHPAFYSPMRATHLRAHQIDEVTALFEEAQTRSHRDDAILLQLRGAWLRVWGDLRDQRDDPIWKSFTDELCSRSFRVAVDQIDFLRAKRSTGIARLQGAEVGRHMPVDRFFFGQLERNDICDLQARANELVEVFRKKADQGHLTREDLSVNAGPTIDRLVAAFHSIFQSNGVLDAVSAYTGRHMLVGGLSLELSDARANWWHNQLPTDGHPKTMYMHLDESIAIPKAIVYLSDVAARHGPTSCFPSALDQMALNPLADTLGRIINSLSDSSSPLAGYLNDTIYHQAMGSAKLRALFMGLPRELRFNSHLGWDVVPGSDLENYLVSIEETLTGPAGSYVVFDGGRLFHRGGLITEGQRVVCQITFSPKLRTNLPARLYRRVKRARRSSLRK